jgi:proline-specific peptidase
MSEQLVELSSGHRIWTRRIVGGSGLPILIVHGGPGTGHDYLESYEFLSKDRPVVFYDQLGCGRSDHPDNLSLWTIERFADEVAEVRAALGLTQCHILGQSWGGFVTIEYLVRRPSGIKSATLASTSASIPQVMSCFPEMFRTLSHEDQSALATHIAAGTFTHPAFQLATVHFYQKYLCRIDPFPDCVMRTIANSNSSPTVAPMIGPTEFNVLGNMRYWTRVADLRRINVPTLVTCGKFDYLAAPNSETLASGISGAKLVVFENSSHCSHLEEPETNRACVSGFLDENDP